MQHRGEIDGLRRGRGGAGSLARAARRGEAGASSREAAKPRRAIKDEPYHIITGAGSTWPEAYYYGMCILEEMQWIRTRPVHASDFFHGTLELVEKGVSVFVFKGEDASRPLVERVENFAPALYRQA